MSMTNKNLQSEYLTIREVRQHLNISQAAAYELAKRQDFPSARFGGSIRIPRDAFLAWVRKCTSIPKDLTPYMPVN